MRLFGVTVAGTVAAKADKMNHRTLQMVVTTAALTLLIGVLHATPGAADPPDRDLPPHEVAYTMFLPAGDYCAFPVDARVDGKQGAIFFGDQALFIFPSATVTLTNVDTDETIALSITGPGRYVVDAQPDGSGTLTVHQWGRWLHPHENEGLFLASGYGLQILHFGPGGVFLGSEEDLSRTHLVDLCAQLAP